jgi:hypothetical protein
MDFNVSLRPFVSTDVHGKILGPWSKEKKKQKDEKKLHNNKVNKFFILV